MAAKVPVQITLATEGILFPCGKGVIFLHSAAAALGLALSVTRRSVSQATQERLKRMKRAGPSHIPEASAQVYSLELRETYDLG